MNNSENIKKIIVNKPLKLDCGKTISDYPIAYETYGKLSEKKVPYISILTDPTMGGVSASFSMLGDIILAEPGALIGFAGPRVIEQTIKQKLPNGFQRAEFQLEHGLIDGVVERKDMKSTLVQLLNLLQNKPLGTTKKEEKIPKLTSPPELLGA